MSKDEKPPVDSGSQTWIIWLAFGIILALVAPTYIWKHYFDPDRGKPAQQQTATPGLKTYTVVGIIRDIPPQGRILSIEHEAIEGFMPAMTMPFTLEKAEWKKQLAVGDTILFDFQVRGVEAVIIRFTKMTPPGAQPTAAPQ